MSYTRVTCAVALLAFAVAGAAFSQPPSKQSLAVPMRDGAVLATDLYLPPGYSPATHPGGLPLILVITPYDKSREKPVDLWRDCFLGNGYAFAVQDMRGFYGSADQGRGAPRHYDGYDTIEWLAAQPWCNGKIGMLGYSHPGAAQYEAAVTTPPHLTCAIPAQAPGNYYTDPLYPPVFRKADYETILRGAFSERTGQLINRRIRSRDDNRLAHFNVPMLHSAGWYDFFKEGAVEMFRACQAQGGPEARGNQKLLIGPWGHGVFQEQDPGQPLSLPGGMVYPPHSKLDWPRDVWLPWFDHWLKGAENEVMEQPAVRYYLMGAMGEGGAPGNEWIETADFPPPSTSTAYHAHADGRLVPVPPAAETASRQYQYDPRDPVPTVGRTHVRLPLTGPFDQRPVEDRTDVLTFTTPELTEPLKVVGQVQVRLWASSDRVDTDFAAKLTDVYPDGRSMIFSDGIVRGRWRNTYLQDEFLTPGQVYEFNIDLGYVAIALAPGHRLRLAISSSNFDRFDINPNTGEPFGDHALTRMLLVERLRGDPAPGPPQYTAALVATNTIYMDKHHPTQVILPLMR